MYKWVISIVMILLMVTYVDAGAFKGKKVYAAQLKDSCGFTGEVMGKKYTKSQWQKFYKNKTLAGVLKKECPKSTLIEKKSDLRALFSFFSLFAKDSGNKASCGG